ncbi:MAG: kynureninase [Candidatus Marinimicrobia bacterium]|nr:kynureninase [Candidatus Neomarinimicrobiota bacterium]
MNNLFSAEFASNLDNNNPLSSFREKFNYPEGNSSPTLYFSGNSLGLQPKAVQSLLVEQSRLWGKYGAKGYFAHWVNFHKHLIEGFLPIVGAQNGEVMLMNALTVNLHLLLISFYQPTIQRHKIIIEKDAFPSDQYAIASQLELHGYNPKTSIIKLKPKPNEKCLKTEDIINTIETHGKSLATVMLGGVNYYTGQKYDMKEIAKISNKVGAYVGFDLAHAAGNVKLDLHDWNVDFAAWCNYKYLNSGPGAPSGIFIHNKHSEWNGPRLAGWWGNNISNRFSMDSKFDPIKGAEGWSISNSPIFSMTPIKASLDIYNQVGMNNFIKGSQNLTGYLEELIHSILPKVEIITPKIKEDRGCQLSMIIKNGKAVQKYLESNNVVCDWREPDVIRLAPNPLYNTYSEIYKLVSLLKSYDKT